MQQTRPTATRLRRSAERSGATSVAARLHRHHVLLDLTGQTKLLEHRAKRSRARHFAEVDRAVAGNVLVDEQILDAALLLHRLEDDAHVFVFDVERHGRLFGERGYRKQQKEQKFSHEAMFSTIIAIPCPPPMHADASP